MLFMALFIGLGALIQTVTGFAMGLIIIGGVTLFGLADIAFTAIVVSLISLLNALMALRLSHKFIDWQLVGRVTATMLPALVLGVILLDFLGDDHELLLRKLLGLVIVSGGILLMLKPAPYKGVSSQWAFWSTGALGGIIGGMYSAGGAPLAYLMYRQPIELRVVRATLLTFFAASTMTRTLVVGYRGDLDAEVLKVVGISVPLVILVTVVTTRFLGYIPDTVIRRVVFMLLLLMGAMLILT